MKSISLFKLFTLVCFLMIGQVSNAAESCEEKCDTTFAIPSTGSTTDASYNNAVKANERCKTRCSSAEQKDEKLVNQCKDLLSKYDDSAKKAAEECSRMGEENYASCMQKARDCSRGLSSSGTEEQDGDSVAAGLVNIIGIYGQMQGANNNGANPSCVIENDDTEASKEERLDEKVTQLRSDIENLKEDAVKEDERLNEKRQKVEEEMQQAEKDFDKIATDNKTKNQEQAGAMQKKIFETEKRKKANLIKVTKLQTQIANLAFGHQEVLISFADNLVTRECRAASASVKEAALKVKQNFSNVESAKLKQDMRTAETLCLQKKAVDKQKVIKGLVDLKRDYQSEIDTLNSSNADETKSIAEDQKQIEALKAIMTESEVKELEQKNKKLNSLNKSVTDLETSIANKKKSLEAKQKAIQDRIDKILSDRQNVKPKFAKVYSSATSTTNNARQFVSQCCATDFRPQSSDRTTARGFADSCTRLRGDNSIKDTKPVTPGTRR
ncbi:MAG: hypothetical protein ABL930_02630 [Pseudobdellovibrio sp.]